MSFLSFLATDLGLTLAFGFGLGVTGVNMMLFGYLVANRKPRRYRNHKRR